MDNLLPQFGRVNLLCVLGIIGTDRILLHVGRAVLGSLHEIIIYLHGDIGSGDFSFRHLGIDELFGVGVFDGDGQHQGTATTILGHFAGGVGEALHERHHTRRGERTVLHVTAGGANVRKVVAHTATAFHQLHLFLVHLHDTTVRVGVIFITNHKTVGQGHNLVAVAYTGHGAALRNDVFELVEQGENQLLAHRVHIALLDAGKLGCHTMVHVFRRSLHDVAVSVLKSILVDPDAGGQFIATKVLHDIRKDFCFLINRFLGFLLFHCLKIVFHVHRLGHFLHDLLTGMNQFSGCFFLHVHDFFCCVVLLKIEKG